jgi:uncharacterized protein YyaL (SSP411 family)
MEEESFRDEEVADLLNRHFISIKVDREERPDIDSVYMKVCQMITGSGGWPLTVFLTPRRQPFFAGTYFPKEPRYGSVGLVELLTKIAGQWRRNRSRIAQVSDELTALLKKPARTTGGGAGFSRESVELALKQFGKDFDPQYGGFGAAPKFPAPQNLLFIMDAAFFRRDNAALKMAETTLQGMFRGGLFDHIGGGFSRYSTDSRWLVPHFEKMLRDNAMLLLTYSHAYLLTGKNLYRTVVRRTAEYLLREMRMPHGAFASSQDADSGGVEGKYYFLTSAEVVQVLGEQDGQRFVDHFGLDGPAHGEGGAIPNLLRNPRFRHSHPELDALCGKIYEYRRERARLRTDDKILTAWNAMAVAAFCAAGRACGEPAYIQAALSALHFLETNLTDDQGCLVVRWREGHQGGKGLLDDYACMAWAYLEAYRSTFRNRFLRAALDTARKMHELFCDSAHGGYFMSEDETDLIVRPKEICDGAMPSGNSVAAYVLTLLDRLTGQPDIRQMARGQYEFLSAKLAQTPAAAGFALHAYTPGLYAPKELVCVLPPEMSPQALSPLLDRAFMPGMTVVLKRGDHDTGLEALAPHLWGYTIQNRQPTYYLCENRACSAPSNNLSDLLQDRTRRRVLSAKYNRKGDKQ